MSVIPRGLVARVGGGRAVPPPAQPRTTIGVTSPSDLAALQTRRSPTIDPKALQLVDGGQRSCQRGHARHTRRRPLADRRRGHAGPGGRYHERGIPNCLRFPREEPPL